MTRLSLKPNTLHLVTQACQVSIFWVTLKIKTWQALTSSHFGTLVEKTMLDIEAPSQTLEFVW